MPILQYFTESERVQVCGDPFDSTERLNATVTHVRGSDCGLQIMEILIDSPIGQHRSLLTFNDDKRIFKILG